MIPPMFSASYPLSPVSLRSSRLACMACVCVDPLHALGLTWTPRCPAATLSPVGKVPRRAGRESEGDRHNGRRGDLRAIRCLLVPTGERQSVCSRGTRKVSGALLLERDRLVSCGGRVGDKTRSHARSYREIRCSSMILLCRQVHSPKNERVELYSLFVSMGVFIMQYGSTMVRPPKRWKNCDSLAEK